MVQKLLKLLRTNIFLILICLVFLGTRIYKIDEIPGSVYWDEASIGYNAYSVLTTGKDEWGETLPLHFRAFGEFKLPVYVYSVVISESLFGMNIFAVRFPAVIFGLLSVVGLYLLVFEVTKKKEVSLLSSFVFSITPYFFIFSRTGYEATAGLAFFIFAVYFLIKTFKNKTYLFVSTVLFIASMYSYNSFRILTPLVLGAGMFLLLLKRNVVPVVLSVIILSASMLPVYKLYTEDSGLGRLQTVGDKKNIIVNYFKNFSPTYLFVQGDSNPRSQVPGSSQLYILDAVFLILGIVYVLKTKNYKYLWIIGLLVIAPIPASITKENPHSLRAILLAPMFSVFIASGIYYLSDVVKNKSVLVLVPVTYMLFFANYFYKFVTKYNDLSSSAWQSEYKEIFENKMEGCVSDEFAQPYIFALFYNKVDTESFIKSRELSPVSDWGFSTVRSFGKYTFPKKCQTN